LTCHHREHPTPGVSERRGGKITGIHQQETIPDAIVRRAEQIEIVDLTPEAYVAEWRTATSTPPTRSTPRCQLFPRRQLSALRELALLWLADRVEDSLQRYLDDHAIDQTWETASG